MEDRGEVRGESCCFMQAMRAVYKSIRDRLRPQRTRQRTKNYRVCRNSAMAKTTKKNRRKDLTSGLNSCVFNNSHVANLTRPANVDTTQSQKQDGGHGELQERLRSSLRASQERRKPRWVLQRGSQHNIQADVSMQEVKAKRFQPSEPNHEIANVEETEEATGDHQLGEPRDKNVEETQVGEDFQPAEPAVWVVAQAQMWREMTEPHPVSRCNTPFMYTGPGSKVPAPPGWELDHLVEGLWGSSENKVEEEREPATDHTNLEDIEARVDFQTGELDIQLDEETSWVVAHAKMWQEMTEPDPVSFCSMPIMYSGPGSKYPVPPGWELEHLMEVWRSEKEEGEQGWLSYRYVKAVDE